MGRKVGHMNIVFDIGGVLADFKIEEYISFKFDEKTAAAVNAATWKNPDWQHLDRGDLSDEEILRLFIEDAPKYEKEIRCLFAKLCDIIHMKESTIPLIKRLKAAGYKVFYLSNYFEYLIHTAPWALEFTEYMDGGVFSCHYHKCKPEAEIYNILCSKYSLDHSECIFIDDRADNVQGAEAVGMKGIHYTGQNADELFEQIIRLS